MPTFAKVKQFLSENNIDPLAFGAAIIDDRQMVERWSKGTRPVLNTMSRIDGFIAAFEFMGVWSEQERPILHDYDDATVSRNKEEVAMEKANALFVDALKRERPEGHTR